MSTFEFTAAIAVRAYGTITIDAETLEAAKAEIQKPGFSMEKAFSPHGGGESDFDWNYWKPAVYLESVRVDGEEGEMPLCEDLPDPIEKPPAPPLKVRLMIGANAYACIEQAGRKTDIRLSPGKSAPASLREYAAEQRERAARYLELAELAERAAATLESKG